MTFSDLDTSTQVILKVIFAVLSLAFLWVIRDILVLLLLAVIIASAMEPLVDYLAQRKVPRTVSVLTVYVLFIGLVILTISLAVPQLVAQVQAFSTNWPAYEQVLASKLGTGIAGAVDLSSIGTHLLSFGSGPGGGGIVSGTFGVFSGVFSLLTVLVISFYIVAEQRSMKQFIATLIPSAHHEFTAQLVEKIQHKMGLWLLGQLILSFSIFLLTFIGLSLLQVPNALLLAVMAGLFEVIPYIGPFISAIPAIIVALAIGPTLALAVAIMYLLIQKLEGYVLVPKVMEKTVGTSPLVVMVALLVGFKLAGIIGLLIAVPLVGALTLVMNEVISSRQNTPQQVI